VSSFHTKDGWHFERGENGDVVITLVDLNEQPQLREFVRLDANTWASVLAHVSAYVESPVLGEAVRAAEMFHAGRSSAINWIATPPREER
jgi:hypothetical protein